MSADDTAQQRMTAFWNTVASQYDAHPGNVPAGDSEEYAAWTEALRDLLPPPPVEVLDIATGTGFIALIAAALGHRVTGVDASVAMLAEARREARRRALDVTFVEGDAVDLAFGDAQFDVMISRHFIWTLREPERAFASWRRMLRPGGRVIAIDSFWATAEPADDGARGANPLFEQHYTEETVAWLPAMHASSTAPIVAMFERAGFADVRVGALAEAHAVAKAPPSREPWYVITAYR